MKNRGIRLSRTASVAFSSSNTPTTGKYLSMLVLASCRAQTSLTSLRTYEKQWEDCIGVDQRRTGLAPGAGARTSQRTGLSAGVPTRNGCGARRSRVPPGRRAGSAGGHTATAGARWSSTALEHGCHRRISGVDYEMPTFVLDPVSPAGPRCGGRRTCGEVSGIYP